MAGGNLGLLLGFEAFAARLAGDAAPPWSSACWRWG
jgi:hypothetical protein